MKTTITNSVFVGGNADGTPFYNALTGTLNMNGWHCIGPAYYGKPTWRLRLAWRLLGVKVAVREKNVTFRGSPNIYNAGISIVGGTDYVEKDR